MRLFKKYPVLLFAITFIGLLSCKKTTAPNFHYEYFGYEQGRYVIYDVLDITHSTEAIIEHDTLRYQLKTVWGDPYIDNEDREMVPSEFSWQLSAETSLL